MFALQQLISVFHGVISSSVHRQQLGNTAEVEPSAQTAYEIHQSHSLK